MTRSDWISLIAATGTLLGLIPAYRLYFAGKKSRKPKRTAKNETSRPEPVPDDGEIDAEKPMGPYARAAALTAMAFVIFVIELVAYSWLANLFKVKVDLDTMPLNWWDLTRERQR